MYKGIVLAFIDDTKFQFLSSIWGEFSEYELVKSDFKKCVEVIKDENKSNVVLAIFDENSISEDELKKINKTNFQKICYLNDLSNLDKIKSSITINDIITKNSEKEIVIFCIDSCIKQYFTINKLKKQKKELDYLKSHNDKIQKFLLDSEKMISLGQQLAGIIHEINTPLGAIKSSSLNMQLSLKEVLEKLPKLFEMISDENVKFLFFKLLEQSANETITLSTREERKLKKELTAEIERLGIEDARDIATKFTKVKIYKDIQEYLPLIQSEHRDFIFDTAYQMSDLQSNNENISIAVKKSTKMIKAIKSYARYDHTEEMSSINLKDSLETVLTIYHNQIKQGTELIRDYDDVEDIMCYSDELNQVWTNLIHNALQAMDFKGTLTVSIKDNSDYQIVSIKDTGCGIPEDIKNKIFDAFFTTKPAGVGTGIGLDILKKIVDKHNGKIEFDSTVDVGSEFRVYLPKVDN
jgi:signal transduction histidine kinase